MTKINILISRDDVGSGPFIRIRGDTGTNHQVLARDLYALKEGKAPAKEIAFAVCEMVLELLPKSELLT